MIGHLTGTLVAAGLGEVVVDVGGVGYRVQVPPGSIRAGVGDEVTLHTHLAVREDAMTLYGFVDIATRDVFEALLAASGVGPRLALAAVGTLGAGGVREAIAAEDLRALTTVPGIGRKSAQRIVLELRERLGADAEVAAAPEGAPTTTGEGVDPRTEVRAALSSLGYAATEVERALDGVDATEYGGAEELLRAALRRLARSA